MGPGRGRRQQGGDEGDEGCPGDPHFRINSRSRC
jgi:hypothetical protein